MIDEHHVGQDVLDLLHLVGGHHDGAAMVEIVVQQHVVELLAVEQVETERGLVQHQQLGVDGHDERQMELGDHALGQLAHLARLLDLGPGQQRFGARAVEFGMHALDIVDGVAHPHPARQHRHVGDEADIAHQRVARGPGIEPEDAELALIRNETEDGVEQRALAGAVGADEAQDLAFVDLRDRRRPGRWWRRTTF